MIPKYRGWHIDERRMFPVKELCWMEDGLYIGEEVDGRTHLYSSVVAIPLQFTGFLDKNGVEIYEGDILSPNKRVVSFGEYFGPFGMGSGFYTESRSGGYDGEQYGLTHRQLALSEIIGNRFENPELLVEAAGS